MHEIKSNIPAPTTRARPGRTAVYPFATMKDGEHFDTPIRDGESGAAAVKRMRTVSASYRRRHRAAMSFTVREATIEDTGEVVVRVWARNSVPPVKRKLDGGPLVDEFFRATK